MPLKSIAQNRLFRWADEHPAEAQREKGIKPAVTQEFLSSAHGKSLKGLPNRVQHKAEGGVVMRAKPFRW